MKGSSWQIIFGAALASLSAALAIVHYAVFHDAGTIISWFLMAGAFLPLEVLIVTVIIQRLLEKRDVAVRRDKLNTVIGIFFAEFGTPLLTMFAGADVAIEGIRKDLIPKMSETDVEFDQAIRQVKAHEPDIAAQRLDLAALKGFLAENRDFIVRLLENPALMEHESFTELLWAVAHLMDELAHRDGFAGLPPADLSHLSLDVKRAYTALLSQWLMYMKHLKTSYPYLFSLAVRINPFDKGASAVVRS